jgi:hypothetical protein
LLYAPQIQQPGKSERKIQAICRCIATVAFGRKIAMPHEEDFVVFEFKTSRLVVELTIDKLEPIAGNRP